MFPTKPRMLRNLPHWHCHLPGLIIHDPESPVASTLFRWDLVRITPATVDVVPCLHGHVVHMPALQSTLAPPQKLIIILWSIRDWHIGKETDNLKNEHFKCSNGRPRYPFHPSSPHGRNRSQRWPWHTSCLKTSAPAQRDLEAHHRSQGLTGRQEWGKCHTMSIMIVIQQTVWK